MQTGEKVWHHQVYAWKEKNTPPTSNLPKVVVIRAVPSCRNAVSWDTIIAPKADSEGEEKKRLWERTRGERWIERQPNVYSPLTKARPVHMLVMELPWHTVKWGIMMTKHCPRTKECERRVKKVNAERASCILVLWLNRDAATGRMSPLSQVWVHLFEIKSEKKRGRWKGIIKDPPLHLFPRLVLDSLTTFRCFLKQVELENLKPQLGLVYVSVRHLCFDAHSQDLTVINKPQA